MSSFKEALKQFPPFLRPHDLVSLGLFENTQRIYAIKHDNPNGVPRHVPGMRNLLFSKDEVEKFISQMLNPKKEEQQNITVVVQSATNTSIPKQEEKKIVDAYRQVRIQSYIPLRHYEYIENEISKKQLDDKNYCMADYIRDLIDAKIKSVKS